MPEHTTENDAPVQVGDLVRLITDTEPYGRVESLGDDDMAQVRALHGDQGVYPCWTVNLRVMSTQPEEPVTVPVPLSNSAVFDLRGLAQHHRNRPSEPITPDMLDRLASKFQAQEAAAERTAA